MILLVLPLGVWVGEVSMGCFPARVTFVGDILLFLVFLAVGRPFSLAGLLGGFFLESAFLLVLASWSTFLFLVAFFSP